MATYTSNYAWTKPSGNDNVDISVLNANLDSQDSIMHDAFANMAQAFSESSTYEVGDIVVYGTTTYKCHTAVTTAGSWTGSTNWQVYKLSEGGSGGGGTSNYNDLTNKPSINGVTLSGNKTASDLSLQDKMQYSTMPTASADNEGKIYQYVGTTDSNYTNGYYYKCVENSGSYSWQLVENINDQTPTFTEASTRNNIASGEKLSVIMGKIAKFFNDLKTVAFSGSYTDLINTPTIPTSAGDITYDNTDSGLTATDVQGAIDELRQADNIMMSDGVTSVEDALDAITPRTIKSVTANGIKTYAQLLIELASLGTGGNALKIGNITFHIANSGNYHSCYFGGDNIIDIYCVYLSSSAAIYKKASITSNNTVSFTNLSNNVPASGTKIERVYM